MLLGVEKKSKGVPTRTHGLAKPNKPKLFRWEVRKKVRFELGSLGVRKICTLPERRTGLVVRFGKNTKTWTELRFGSEKFRFELRFRTELRHPYIRNLHYLLSRLHHQPPPSSLLPCHQARRLSTAENPSLPALLYRLILLSTPKLAQHYSLSTQQCPFLTPHHQPGPRLSPPRHRNRQSSTAKKSLSPAPTHCLHISKLRVSYTVLDSTV